MSDTGMNILIDKIKEVKEDVIQQLKDQATEQTKTHEEIQKKITEIENKYESEIKDIQDRFKEMRVSVPGLEEEKGILDKFSFQRAYRSIMSGNWRDAEFEKEIYDSTEAMGAKRAAEVSGTTGVGFWVPEEISDQYIDLALAEMPLYDVVTKMPNMVGDFSIPVLLTRPDGDHTSESGESTEINYTFGDRKFSPKRASGYTKISTLTLRQTGNRLEPLIREQLQKSLRVEIHKKMIDGSGTSDEPAGVNSYVSDFTATDAIGTNGGRWTVQKATEMKTNLEEADQDVMAGRYAYLCRPVVLEGLKLERIAQYSGDSTGQYVFDPVLTDKRATDILGYPVYKTTHLPKATSKGTSTTLSNVIFGDWANFYMALWSGLELRISNQASDSSGNSAFLKNQVWMIVDQYYDVNIGDRKRFTYVSDAETTRSNW